MYAGKDTQRDETKTLQVGQIVNTHGLRGEVKVVAWTDTPDVFEDLETVYTDIKNEREKPLRFAASSTRRELDCQIRGR